MSHVTPTMPVVEAPAVPTAPAITAPTIATRQRCHPDGIGLSHYVLMDRKAAK